jgi:YedE family putative selenium metabolism protein
VEPLLRSESAARNRIGIALMLPVGAAAAAIVALGNPGNMGVCGVCFLRDAAGALGLSSGPGIFRPELVGVALGALALVLATGRFQARSGSHAAARLLLGATMSVAALVFLGCPFRTLQRLGGGDLNAWIALPGFVVGVGVAHLLERRGYSVGRTSPAPAAVGLLGPLVFAGLLAAFIAGGLRGPGPGDAGAPAHAPWAAALAIAFGVGVLLSATGFCAVSAARSVFQRRRAMLFAAGAMVAGYAAVALWSGGFSFSKTAPLAHGDVLWNLLSLALLGIAGALAGGCPVRQVVMTGEGNGDAFVTVLGILVGAGVAHHAGWVSTFDGPKGPGGATAGGQAAVVVGLVVTLLYGWAVARARTDAPAAAEPVPTPSDP